MKDEELYAKPSTSVGCTKKALKKLIQFKNEYNAQWKANLANYEIAEILIDAGIEALKKTFKAKP